MTNLPVFSYFVKVCLLALFMVGGVSSYASPLPGPTDYYASPQINAGQKLVLEIAFGNPPVSSLGAANGLILDFGGFNTGNELTNLYIAGHLIGSTSTYPTPVAVFQSPAVPRFFLGTYVDPLALESVFNGTNHAFIEIIPTIDAGTVPYIYFSGQAIHGITVTGEFSSEDIFPSATLIRESILPFDAPLSFTQVPEPSTLLLILAGLPMFLLAIRRKTLGNLL